MMNYFAELKKALVERAFLTAEEAILRASRKLRGFAFQLLVLFVIDLNRNLPSRKLRRYWDPDFENAMLTAGRNLVRFDALRQGYRPLKLAVRGFLIVLSLLLCLSFPGNR